MKLKVTYGDQSTMSNDGDAIENYGEYDYVIYWICFVCVAQVWKQKL